MKNTMVRIRQEEEKDFAKIYDLVEEAFKTAKVSDGDEQDFVDRLRAGDHYIPELAFVAEESDRLVGHIMLTRCRVMMKEGTFDALLLAPLAVVLEYRNRGVGADLVKEALRSAKEKGHKAVFLTGDPVYYGRFGFKSVANYGIGCAEEIPLEYVLACELIPGSLEHVDGKLSWE